VEADVHRHQRVKSKEDCEAKEVLIPSATFRWDSVVLKEENPNGIPPSFEAKTLMFTRCARLLQG